MRPLLTFIIVLALSLPGETGQVRAATLDSPLRHHLAAATTSAEIPIIVTLVDGVALPRFDHLAPGRQRRNARLKALRERTEASQHGLRQFLQAAGVGKFKPLWTINGLALQASPELIASLVARPEVAEVRLDGTVNLPAPVLNAIAGSEWNISAVGAPRLWALGLTGSGVVVASLDSGVDPRHSDLAGKYRGGVGAWFDPNGQHATPYDKSGHGTAVMGVMLGGEATGTAIGVAPGAQWIAAKIFNDGGSASYSAIHLAFAWALDPDGDGDSGDAPQVVNNSWGLDGVNRCLPEFQPDIRLLQDHGIAVVFSGGNSGPNPTSSTSPANYPESLAVGAVDQAGAIASFSGRGPSPCPGGDQLFPQLAAPGVYIKSADLTLLGAFPNAYAYYDGTSFSAPHVSGLMALLLGQNDFPATLAALETALENGADDLGSLGPDQTFGHGLANGLAAFRRLQNQPHLAIHDPRPPEHDRRLDFGSLPVGATLDRTLTLRNSGGGLLVFANHDWSGLSPALTVTGDFCSGQTLAANETCQLTVSFAPPAALAYTATLNLTTNALDFNPVAVILSGSGNNNPTPPTLQIEPLSRTVEFGAVPPGGTSQRELILGNTGQELLTIAPLDFSGLAAPFALVTDGCSSASLAINESCTVLFSFNPPSLQDYQTQLSITANDPENSPATVLLHGNGNHPPIAARLVFPTDGATGLDTNLTLRWLPGTDPDGDPLREQVVLTAATPAATPAFAGSTGGTRGIWFGVGLLLLATLPLLRHRRARLLIQLTITLFTGLTFLAACGGGGGGAAPASVTYSTFTPNNLAANTTYNWQVVTTDSRGASTTSPVWQFTTL